MYKDEEGRDEEIRGTKGLYRIYPQTSNIKPHIITEHDKKQKSLTKEELVENISSRFEKVCIKETYWYSI